MSEVLADTHSILWFIADLPRLSAVADTALTDAARTGGICISAITLVEVDYLETKRSFPYPGVLRRLMALINDPADTLKVLPVTTEVAVALARVPRDEVPDMPDRIIAATAVAHGLPLVSVDSDIQTSASLNAIVRVIW